MSEIARRISILVADQNRNSLAAFKALLGTLNADVTTASTAEQALSAIATRGVDFVLLNIEMLGAHAVTVLVGKRADTPACGMVLLGTAGTFTGGIPAEDFFAMPVDPDRLLVRISALIKARH